MKSPDRKATGRVVHGAAVDLIEYVDNGHYSTGLRWRDGMGSRHEVDAILAKCGHFLRDPVLEGIVELDDWDASRHELIYPTGRSWTLGELLQTAREKGESLGVRAGLEVAYLGSLMLQQGQEAGEGNDVPMHCNPNPWRWFLDEEGELHLLGWGIPALELYAQDANAELMLPAESYRYLSPERLQGGDEDITSDLFALTLVAAECIAGEPVYAHHAEDARNEADHADATRKLYQWRELMPESVRLFMTRALAQYPDGRFEDPEDYVHEAHNLLYSPIAEGPSLADIVRRLLARGDLLVSAAAPAPDTATKSDTPDPGPRWEAPNRSDAPCGDRPSSHSKSRPAHKRRGPVDASRKRMQRSSEQRELRERMRASIEERPHHPRRHRALRDRNSLFPRQDPPGETERYLFRLPDGHTAWARLSPEESLAMSAARVADKACPSPIDATGQLTGWFRISQGADAWYGDAQTDVLDPEEECNLRAVKNRIVQARLFIEGVTEEAIDFPVGTAVAARFLVSHLRQAHDLRARDWQLWAEADRAMDPWQMLDDYDMQDGTELVLRRGGRQRLKRRR